MNGISTEKLLLEEIRNSRQDYRETMAAISETDKTLASVATVVNTLNDRLGSIPSDCSVHSSRLDQMEKRLSKQSDSQIKLARSISELKAQSSGVDLKTVDGWRKAIPYFILGGVSLWGIIQQGLSSLQ